MFVGLDGEGEHVFLSLIKPSSVPDLVRLVQFWGAHPKINVSPKIVRKMRHNRGAICGANAHAVLFDGADGHPMRRVCFLSQVRSDAVEFRSENINNRER
jgi:hypothetical protein